MDENNKFRLINLVREVESSQINNIDAIRDCVAGAALEVIERRIDLLEKKQNESYAVSDFFADTLIFCILAATSEILIAASVTATLNSLVRLRGITGKAINQKSMAPFKKIELKKLFSLETKDLKLKNTLVYDILNKGISSAVEKSLTPTTKPQEQITLKLMPAAGMQWQINNWSTNQKKIINNTSTKLIDTILDFGVADVDFDSIKKEIKTYEVKEFSVSDKEDIRTYFEIIIWIALYPIYNLAGSENPPLFEGYNSGGLESDVWNGSNDVYSVPLSAGVKKEFDKLAAKGKLIKITIFNEKIWQILKEKIDSISTNQPKTAPPKVGNINTYSIFSDPKALADNILNTKDQPYYDFLNKLNNNFTELNGKVGVYYQAK